MFPQGLAHVAFGHGLGGAGGVRHLRVVGQPLAAVAHVGEPDGLGTRGGGGRERQADLWDAPEGGNCRRRGGRGLLLLLRADRHDVHCDPVPDCREIAAFTASDLHTEQEMQLRGAGYGGRDIRRPLGSGACDRRQVRGGVGKRSVGGDLYPCECFDVLAPWPPVDPGRESDRIADTAGPPAVPRIHCGLEGSEAGIVPEVQGR